MTQKSTLKLTVLRIAEISKKIFIKSVIGVRGGKNNPSFEYFMSDSDGNSVILDVVDQEKHLGVTMEKELTFRQLADLIVSKANRIMGLIRRSFTYLDERSFAMLFKALVRPILESNNTIWHPRFKSIDAKIESVQRGPQK